MFKKLKLRRKLQQIGCNIDTSYVVKLNNDDLGVSLPDYQSVLSYLEKYRQDNEIFKLGIYRVEIYSL